MTDIISEVATVVKTATPFVASVSPTAGAIVALVSVALQEEPALVALIESVIADFKGTSAASQVPLDFKDQSQALENALHPSHK